MRLRKEDAICRRSFRSGPGGATEQQEHLAAQLNKLRDAVADLIVCSLALK
jgi:hypothetical protein